MLATLRDERSVGNESTSIAARIYILYVFGVQAVDQ
jgi:hypothetical protein